MGAPCTEAIQTQKSGQCKRKQIEYGDKDGLARGKLGKIGRARTPITKIGSVHLRRGLFMPAMTARVFNPLLKTFADRLLENGKKPKQIIIAVMRKLLHQIYGILKSGQPYNPDKRGFAGS